MCFIEKFPDNDQEENEWLLRRGILPISAKHKTRHNVMVLLLSGLLSETYSETESLIKLRCNEFERTEQMVS